MRENERDFLYSVRFKNDFRFRDIFEDYEFLRSKGVTLGRLKKYLAGQIQSNQQECVKEISYAQNLRLETEADWFYLFVRYHKAAQKLFELSGISAIDTNVKEDLYPINLFERYDSINDGIIKAEVETDAFSAAVKNYLKFEMEFEYGGEKYIAKVPKTPKELIMEGVNMHNCLVMRGPFFVRGEMKIICLTKADGKPFLDIILNEKDQIIWAILDCHEGIKGDELEKVVSVWYNTVVKKVQSNWEMWEPRCFC